MFCSPADGAQSVLNLKSVRVSFIPSFFLLFYLQYRIHRILKHFLQTHTHTKDIIREHLIFSAILYIIRCKEHFRLGIWKAFRQSPPVPRIISWGHLNHQVLMCYIKMLFGQGRFEVVSQAAGASHLPRMYQPSSFAPFIKT